MSEMGTALGSQGRIARLAAVLTAHEVGGVVVGPGSDLRYLAGYHALALERPTLLVVRADGGARLVAPLLEEPRARTEVVDPAIEIVTYRELEDPYALVSAQLDDLASPVIALGDQLWTMFSLAVQQRLPELTYRTAAPLMAQLRMRKDAQELTALARVGAAIDRVHLRVEEVLSVGRSERAVAEDLAAMIREEHDQVDFVIVAAGPNSASPHHEPGEHLLCDGDVVVVDIGGTLEGYCSDMTRTYVLGTPPAGFEDAYSALERAHAAGVAAVRPGVRASEVDAAARGVLEAAGLGEAFIHRTGHGIGLDTHEAPWIVEGDMTILEEGMTFSVEPGFYRAGWAGARIEDIVAVTAEGARTLNTVDRGLKRIGR
jgi:Xaa-Pro aminopeptidase